MTTVERIGQAVADCRKQMSEFCDDTARREFAIAITALEDAAMRFNRGVAKKNGLPSSADVEAGLAAIHSSAVDPPHQADVHPGQTTFEGM